AAFVRLRPFIDHRERQPEFAGNLLGAAFLEDFLEQFMGFHGPTLARTRSGTEALNWTRRARIAVPRRLAAAPSPRSSDTRADRAYRDTTTRNVLRRPARNDRGEGYLIKSASSPLPSSCGGRE